MSEEGAEQGVENQILRKQASGLRGHIRKLHSYGELNDEKRDHLDAQVKEVEEELQSLYESARSLDTDSDQ